MMQQPYAVEASRGPVRFYSVGAPIVGITQDDVDAAEWAAIEAEHIRCPHSGYLIPKPNRESRGIMTWTGIGCGKGRAHPRAYKMPGKAQTMPARATSAAQAELLLSGTSTRYTAPQLGPEEYGKYSPRLKYNLKKNAWTEGGR